MWQKFKNGFRGFMTGRNGPDQLGIAILVAGLVLSLIGSSTRISIFNYIGIAGYVYALVRMFSRNVEKRRAENARFIGFFGNFRTNAKQFINRTKNAKQYKYFKCPQCNSRLRLPRNVGEVTVTCGKCKHQFKQKA